MTLFRGVLIVMLLVTGMNTSAEPAEQEKLRVGFFYYGDIVPYSWHHAKTGRLVGATIAYRERIFNRLGYTVEWIPFDRYDDNQAAQPWSRLGKDIDIMISSFHPEVEKSLSFFALPDTNLSVNLYVRPEDISYFSKPANLSQCRFISKDVSTFFSASWIPYAVKESVAKPPSTQITDITKKLQTALETKYVCLPEVSQRVNIELMKLDQVDELVPYGPPLLNSTMIIFYPEGSFFQSHVHDLATAIREYERGGLWDVLVRKAMHEYIQQHPDQMIHP